jgi:hypothetical protein
MNSKTLKHCLLAVLLSANLIGGKATASPVTIPDFSFELWTNAATGFGLQDGATTPGPDVGPDWRGAGNGGINLVNPTNGQFAGTTGFPGTLPPTGDGSNYLFIGLGNDGHCWQTIGTLQSNIVYTLTVAVGNTLSNDGGLGTISLVSGTFPGGKKLGSAPVDSTALTPGTFADSTLVFTTGQHASGPLTILLEGTAGSGTQMIYDNVRLDATAAPAMPTALVPAVTPSSNVYVGTVVTLTEDPAGAAPFSYQWQADNGSGGATFSNISGANSTNLVVDTALTGVGSFEYRVVVSNSFGPSTSVPVTLAVQSGQPVLTVDALPATGSDVVGSSVTFTAVFDGNRPITYQWQVQDTNGDPIVNIPGATNSTLTLTNLQLTDYAFYTLQASNALGVVSSTERLFVVNPVPAGTNGIIIETANQIGPGGNVTFSPTWTISTNSDLIAGALPSTVGPGAFNDPQEHIGGTPVVLTDGKFGTLYPQGITSPDVVTGGTVASGAGQYLIYTLPASATGYDLTNIVTYGGWADAGRDEQRYTLYYSTVAAPTNFTAFADVMYNPSNPSSVQSATRVTITPSGAAPLVKNVAALKFDFSTLNNGAENGFVGYSEFQVYGTNSAPAPVLASDTEPGSASDVVGDQITFAASFTGATAYQWLKVVSGVTNSVPGATNQTLTLANLQPGDTGTYLLFATNASGSGQSSGSPLTVNTAGNALISGTNLIASGANQTGRGATYTPNWVVATNNDLIFGASPTGIGSGVFNQEGSGGIAILTDGAFGSVGGGINTSLATVGQNAGQSVTYTLNGPASGFDITNIVTYGGWSDGGRDQQAYTVSYSTVLDPATFITVGTVSFNPTLPGSVPSADRLTLSSTNGPLATNVAKIKFDFTNPGIENGYGGLAELGVFGSASAAVPLAPYVVYDILPVTGSDVVGSQVRFTATFNGTAPITYQWQVITNGVTNNVPGATSPTLTLNNLQLTNSGSYQLQASNSVGVTYSSTNLFTVNPVPAPNGNGVIASPANQTGNGAFTPTWIVAPGSLIAGTLPSSVGVGGSFTADPGEGGLPVLTDGMLDLFGASVAGLATCGSGNGGHSITYTLPVSGKSIINIVSYAGWADGGRDQQAYTVSYSTVTAPATFTTIASVNYNPTLPGAVPSADRVTLVSSTGGPIATNVAAVTFDFLNPAGENGYSGYAEFQIFGTAVPPTINSPKVSGGNLILTGTGGTPGGSYTWLTSTNLATPVASWTTNTTGTFDGSGAFSNAIPINHAELDRFFLLRTP